MSTRLIQGGRVTWQSRDWKPFRPTPVDADRAGNLIDTSPIGPDDAESPLRVGVPFLDPEDGVVYRVLATINVLEGWAVGVAWMRRWRCAPGDLKELVERGKLDAAMQLYSASKWYRCRDEVAVLAYLKGRRRRR